MAGAAGAAWSLSDLWLAPVSAQSPKARTGPWRTWGGDALKQAKGLGCTYAVVLVSGGWLIPAMMVVGLADAVFGFRRRFLKRRPPPLPAS